MSDSAIASRINAARSALGDDGTAQRVIKTVPKRGFRFEADLSASDMAPVSALPEKPSVAVLPFQNMSGDPEQRYFSDGITDDIITELARFEELFVIARHSSFAFTGTQATLAEIAAELGVRFIAEGSVRRAGNRVRVTARLVDPVAGNELWAERYDREIADIFEVQDEITAMIVNALAGEITLQHVRRVRAKTSEAIDAYDRVLKATELALQIEPETNRQALDEAQAALRIDPGVARAYSIISLVQMTAGNNFWVADQVAAFASAYDASQKAVVIDARDPWSHAMLGCAELWYNKAHGRAMANMQAALDLNPSNAQIRALRAYVLPFCGEAETALYDIDLAIRMNPRFPPVFHGFRGRALFALRRMEDSLLNFEEMVKLMPGHTNALGYAAVAYVALDRLDEARATVASIVSSNTYYRLGRLRRVLPFAREEDRNLILDNLARAGLPEE